MIGMVKGKGSRGWAEVEIYLKPGSAEGRKKCVGASKSSMGNGWTCAGVVYGEKKLEEGRGNRRAEAKGQGRPGRLRTTRT
jgi:hypothetical protein